MKYIWYLIFSGLQCTWGLAQTMVGMIIFLIHRKKPHSFYRGCICTKWNSFSGLSMGLFMFIPNEKLEDLEQYAGHSKKGLVESCSKIAVHEYGHAYQSLILGPIFIIPGIWSILWGRMKRYEHLRTEYGVPYSFCWVESWANSLGEKITKLPSIGNG